MVLSYYLRFFPYKLIWKILKLQKKLISKAFFCDNLLDFFVFEPVYKLDSKIIICAKNKYVKAELLKLGVNSVLYPVYPKMIIMTRHSLHYFPEKKIKKIGMRHGAYHFKDFISSKKYNMFDKYMFTSTDELKEAEKRGIKSGVFVGFPKIDPLFNSKKDFNLNKKSVLFNPKKYTIMLSATWDKSSFSSIFLWYKNLNKLTKEYNVLVTTHPFTSKYIVEEIKRNNDVFYIEHENLLSYYLFADILISDVSSIIAEFSSLNKPIITFNTNSSGRFLPKIKKMIDEISCSVENFDELLEALPNVLRNPDKKEKERLFYNKVMFDNLDGKASERALKVINEVFN